ncbi:MAG: lactoylglutathione lyase [Thermodesulfobacteriota bacterium]|nr:MAG: lactoylglutathione lyase [Thermodesulfobacteriota bacterium]
MKLGYTILYVEDVKETLKFYEEAFGFKELFLHESGDYGELDTGDTKLAFASHVLAESNDVGFSKSSKNKEKSTMEIALVTDDVRVAFDRAVRAGAIALHQPKEKPWGQTVAYIRDLNGFLVELCSPI